MRFTLLSLFVFFSSYLLAQSSEKKNLLPKELRYNLSEDGEKYVKATFLAQVWGRYTDNNPGTTLFGYNEPQSYDMGLRRVRIQFFGQITDRVFIYTQIGQNNLSSSGTRKQGLFFHDALGEIKVYKDYISIGGGLNTWTGPTRYASPAIGGILTLDAPLYQQNTADVSDQFLRKLSIYAKGKLGKFDYRIAASDPMAIANSNQANTIGANSLFSLAPPKVQFTGYFMYQFFDQESNTTPFHAGTYHGKKNILNIGAGFVNQADAMWRQLNNGDTVHTNLNIFAADIFFEKPLNTEKRNAITTYGSFTVADFGQNYIRNVGVMNPANGTTNAAIVNGGGNAFPAVGTGNTFYAQFGYIFKKDLLKSMGTIQPFAAIQYSDYEALKDGMTMYELGANWLIAGNNAKLSIEYQSRPVFETQSNGDALVTDRQGMIVMQLQVSI